jgi:hypothetical protein
MNKLLQTIKENDKEFDGLFDEIYQDEVITATFSVKEPSRAAIKSHITQSRIKELETLVEMIMEKVKSDTNAKADIIQTLQDIIKELKDAL